MVNAIMGEGKLEITVQIIQEDDSHPAYTYRFVGTEEDPIKLQFDNEFREVPGPDESVTAPAFVRRIPTGRVTVKISGRCVKMWEEHD